MKRPFPWPAALFLAVALIALVVFVATLGEPRQPRAIPTSLTPLAGDHEGTGQIYT